ncbi:MULTISPECIES: NAD(P)H-dependent oxidoreductase [Duganella]|uniref:Flavodoxin family protein n=2 Tax=Duganella TaxID=75654 RepID=A0A845GR99_9BURK|nr:MULTISPECIES: NAD(P)H-dependent oxidoreductase [Duganella]MYM80761.1 flavodoxin family protein [Duganella lactea]MYM96135.1 flavodoxin family protein [Duganella vulcania]
MKKVHIINAHLPYAFAAGRLNATLAEMAVRHFQNKGYEVQKTVVAEGYDVTTEIAKITSSDIILVQTPLNWMGTPWIFKKYTDEVWTAGMMGKMSAGDGRSAEAPTENYGMGGLLNGRYMLSVTANAPKEAFNDQSQEYFSGRSEDDLTLPIDLNFKWIGLDKVPAFWAYDVMKNAQIEKDLERFANHLSAHF